MMIIMTFSFSSGSCCSAAARCLFRSRLPRFTSCHIVGRVPRTRNAGKWTQTPGALNLLRVFLSKDEPWIWDLRPSLWKCELRTDEKWPYCIVRCTLSFHVASYHTSSCRVIWHHTSDIRHQTSDARRRLHQSSVGIMSFVLEQALGRAVRSCVRERYGRRSIEILSEPDQKGAIKAGPYLGLPQRCTRRGVHEVITCCNNS